VLQNVDNQTIGRHPDYIPYFSVRSEVHDAGVYPPHAHDYFEFLLLLSGARIQHIESTNFAAEEGDLVFLSPGINHGATRRNKNQTLIIGFNLSFLHPELPLEASRAWDRPAALEAAPEILPFIAQSKVEFRCSSKLAEKLREMATELMINSTLTALGARARARSLLSLLLLEVVQVFESQIVDAAHDHRPAPNSSFFEDLTAFIDANLAEPVTVENAARELCVSPSSLSSKVRRTTGASFSELLGNARLKKARELLVFTDSRISEIAFSCGFEDNAYFSRRFRQVTGMTPGDYRQRGKSADFHRDDTKRPTL
jgi:AraC-like DNA-binding protein